MLQSLEASLRRLRTDYVDVLWVHIWDPFTPLEEVVRALDDAVNALAAERGVSSSQVAIAWVRAQQGRGVVIPIIGARSLAQAQENLGALELELSGDELARLDAVSRIELGFPHDFAGGRLA